MNIFSKITAEYLPLPIKDIDTDMIVPAQFLTAVTKEGFGETLFHRLRSQDPSFPMNNPKYKDAKIIVADSNFGCGSSREHAVWAILSAGFSVVIAKSFSDIFFGNAMKNGLLLITLPTSVVDALLDYSKPDDAQPLTVDLNQQTVVLPTGEVESFAFDPFRKHCFLTGQDDFDYLLSQKNHIDSYWSKQAL